MIPGTRRRPDDPLSWIRGRVPLECGDINTDVAKSAKEGEGQGDGRPLTVASEGVEGEKTVPGSRAPGASPATEETVALIYQTVHDLKTPLSVVAGHLEHLEETVGPRLDGTEREHLTFAREGLTHAQERVRALLRYAKAGSGGAQVEPVDLVVVVEQAISNLGVDESTAQARIIHDDLPVVEANREDLVQLFENLLGNAIKYQGDTPPRIRISHERVAGGYRFSIEDDGIGIGADEQDGIFEMFERASQNGGPDGMGIGLAICKRIVLTYQGRIWVDSELGEGSTFHFTLGAELGTVGDPS